MLIPTYWAEARVQEKAAGRSVTVRRWGWSDESEAAALAHGEERARAAIAEIVASGRIEQRSGRTERSVEENGGDGIPIREVIVSRNDEGVVTRNSDGALCLNVADVLMVDVPAPISLWSERWKHEATPSMFRGNYWRGLLVRLGFIPASMFLFLFTGDLNGALQMLLPSVAYFVVIYYFWRRKPNLGELPRVVLNLDVPKPVRAFAETRPDWLIHIYRTSDGFRVLATHAVFDARSDASEAAMRELGVSADDRRWSGRHNAFRARVTPNPWRVRISGRFLPRGGIWQFKSGGEPRRTAWLATYAEAAAPFAACRFLETLGSGTPHPKAEAVRRLHDELSGALSGKPIA